MSYLKFDRKAGRLSLIYIRNDSKGHPHQFVARDSHWPAANNVDSRSRGPWPEGEFPFSYWVSHRGDPPCSTYGSHGVLVFDVPGREGMGVHAGRLGVPDGRGRSGHKHATMGCIRTTEDAMEDILDLHADDPLTHIVVT